MAIILNPQPNFGQVLGSTLGAASQGAGSVLTALADQKLQDMAQQQQIVRQHQEAGRLASQYKSLGLPEALAYTPQNVQPVLGKELMAQRQRQQLAELLTGQPVMPAQTLPSTLGSNVQPQQMIQRPVAQPVVQQAKVTPAFDYEAEKAKIAPLAAYNPAMYQQALSNLDRRQEHQEKMAFQREKLKTEEEAKKTARGEIKFEKMADDAKTEYAKHQNLKMMESVAKSGNLQTGPAIEAINRLGWQSVLNPETQQFKVFSNQQALQFAKQMKGNLSDKDVVFIQSLLPNLFMTPQGIVKAARIQMLASKIETLPYEYADQLTKSGEKAPSNIFSASLKQTAKDRKIYAQLALKLARNESVPMRDLPDGTTQMKFNNNWYDV